MPPSIKLRRATTADLLRLTNFLEKNGLPTVGVESSLENFFIASDHNGSWVGIAGFELYGKSCLLRSVAVDSHFRGRGVGKTLVEIVLSDAKAKGAMTAYLLTDEASGYFERLGFRIVGRKDIDQAVKNSKEFTEACPETATAMRKLTG